MWVDKHAAQDTKALRDTKVLQEFYTMLSNDSARAFYGPGHIRAAHELGAIGTLLITDTVLLVHDVNKASPRHFSCRLSARNSSSTRLHVTTRRMS